MSSYVIEESGEVTKYPSEGNEVKVTVQPDSVCGQLEASIPAPEPVIGE